MTEYELLKRKAKEYDLSSCDEKALWECIYHITDWVDGVGSSDLVITCVYEGINYVCSEDAVYINGQKAQHTLKTLAALMAYMKLKKYCMNKNISECLMPILSLMQKDILPST